MFNMNVRRSVTKSIRGRSGGRANRTLGVGLMWIGNSGVRRGTPNLSLTAAGIIVNKTWRRFSPRHLLLFIMNPKPGRYESCVPPDKRQNGA